MKDRRTYLATLRVALALLCVAFSVAYAQDVRTNYMPGTDFSKYHTYAWAGDLQGVPKVGGQPDGILDAQVKWAIDLQMAAKGFAKVEDGGKADILLGYQLAIDRERQINGFSNGWGGWGFGAAGVPLANNIGTFSANTSTSYVGTFVVGIYDPAAKKLLWIGAIQHAIEPSKKQEQNQKNLNKGAQKLLKDFPPGRSK